MNSKQKTAYEMQSGDWSSDVCSSDLTSPGALAWGRVETEYCVPPEPSQGLQTPGGSPAKHHGAAVAVSREPESHRLGAFTL